MLTGGIVNKKRHWNSLFISWFLQYRNNDQSGGFNAKTCLSAGLGGRKVPFLGVICPFCPKSVSVEWLKRSTNSLKGRYRKNASPIQ
jgi:hypothetical protein